MTYRPNPRHERYQARQQVCKAHKATGEACHICFFAIDYTLSPLEQLGPVVDEIKPLKYGGSPYDYDNTHCAHRWCNRIKSTHSLEWARKKVKELIAQGKSPFTQTKPEPIQSSQWF